jgi:hypothetical protein
MVKFLSKTIGLLANLILAVVFIFTCYFFIGLHNLSPFRDSLFNIKESYHAENQLIFSHSLTLDSISALKVKVKFTTALENSIYSFSVNGKGFRYTKKWKKRNGITGYEFWIPEDSLRKENSFIIKLSRPLSGNYKINFKNNHKFNRSMYLIYERPYLSIKMPVFSFGIFLFLIVLFYIFIRPKEGLKKRTLRQSAFILLLVFWIAIEYLFNFSIKSNIYFSIFLFGVIFYAARKRIFIFSIFSRFLATLLNRWASFRNKIYSIICSPKAKLLLKQGLFSFITFVIIFLLLEIISFGIIQLYYFRTNRYVREYEYFIKTGKGYSRYSIASWTSHPYIPYLPEININEEDGQLFNSYGYRSRTVHGDKGIRVVCLGESTTFGWRVKTEETWCYLLEKSLRKYFNRDDIYVINFGIPTAPSELSLAVLHFKALALEPQLVLVLQGISEAEDWAEDGRRKADFSDFALRANWPERKLLSPFLVFASRSCFFRLFLYIKASYSPQIIPYFYGVYEGLKRVPNDQNKSLYKLVPWQETYKRNLKSMVGISKINNIDICLLENMEHSGPTNVTDVINAVTEEVAKETGVNYIRLTHLPDDYFADYYHLLPEGHAYKAKEIFKYLIENKSQIFNKK